MCPSSNPEKDGRLYSVPGYIPHPATPWYLLESYSNFYPNFYCNQQFVNFLLSYVITTAHVAREQRYG
jgi:hypothetical protein